MGLSKFSHILLNEEFTGNVPEGNIILINGWMKPIIVFKTPLKFLPIREEKSEYFIIFQDNPLISWSSIIWTNNMYCLFNKQYKDTILQSSVNSLKLCYLRWLENHVLGRSWGKLWSDQMSLDPRISASGSRDKQSILCSDDSHNIIKFQGLI